MSITTFEGPTREQDNAVERLYHDNAQRLAETAEPIKVYPGSPRTGCIQATLPWGESHHIDEDGNIVHTDVDHSR